MVAILRRQLNAVRWFSLFLLFVGISLVQVENMTATTPKQDVNAFYGLMAVVGACKLNEDELGFHVHLTVRSFSFQVVSVD